MVPIVITDVAAAALAVCEPVQAVALTEVVEHVYDRVSPAVGGVATEGPPDGEKSVVMRTTTLPVPPVLVVRNFIVKLVVPVMAVAKVVLAVAMFVVPVVTLMEASGGTTTESVVVPVAACPKAFTLSKAASAPPRILIFVVRVIRI